jgi:hypothetical protein
MAIVPPSHRYRVTLLSIDDTKIDLDKRLHEDR